jgi:hypothetical protein
MKASLAVVLEPRVDFHTASPRCALRRKVLHGSYTTGDRMSSHVYVLFTSLPVVLSRSPCIWWHRSGQALSLSHATGTSGSGAAVAFQKGTRSDAPAFRRSDVLAHVTTA